MTEFTLRLTNPFVQNAMYHIAWNGFEIQSQNVNRTLETVNYGDVNVEDFRIAR